MNWKNRCCKALSYHLLQGFFKSLFGLVVFGINQVDPSECQLCLLYLDPILQGLCHLQVPVDIVQAKVKVAQVDASLCDEP